MKNVFLIGYMGTGKSTVASWLSQKRGMEIIEMDEQIVAQEGQSISDIFAQKGERYFRDLETELLLEIMAKDNKVVSCGGGIVLRDENVAIMKESGVIVLLTAEPETIFERVKQDHNRPLLQGNKNIDFIKDMMEKRRPKYECAADIIIQTDGKNIADIADEILEQIKNKEE